MRPPLGKVLGLGTARDGTEHWWGQRVSAVALVFLGLWFTVAILLLPDLQFEVVRNFVGRPFNSVLLSLLTATLAYHSALGVQVVVEDYVHSAGLKIAALIASRFAHAFVAVASIYAILKIGIGA